MRNGLLVLSAALILAAILAAPTPTVHADESRVHLDVRLDPSHPDPEQLLAEAGFEIELAVPELGRWQGWIPSDRVDALREIEGVLAAERPQYGAFAAGDALTEGDEALNAGAARDRFDVDGSGVRVAVISDGVVGLQQAQHAAEAPKLVEARAFGAGRLNRGQEGTVMIEIVHDIAPGASISFGAVTTDLDHIAAVNYYAQRVDIIVDDVSYAFPADQRSDVSVNTTRALQHPDWPLRLYVTAAGNWAESHWAGEWRAGPDGSQLGLSSPGAVQQFNGAAGPEKLFGAGNGFTIEPNDQIRLALFWDDPWGRSNNDYNLYLLSEPGTILASSETTQGIGVDNHDPREHIEYIHQGDATELFVVIQNHNNDAEPVRFDLFAFRGGGSQLRLDHRTPAGSILAQSDARDALTVGAVNVGRNTVAPYSSRGPTVNGANKPELSAVDRVTVSDKTHFAPRFSGSSAAAPHVAGVAALMLDVQPALLAADGGNPLLERRLIRDILISTAQDIPPAGHDSPSGAGLVDAVAALEMANSEIAVIDSTADSGPRTLRDALRSRASIILLRSMRADRTIVLQSPLPIVAGPMIIDGTGWTLDASAVDLGVPLGDNVELWGLTVRGASDVGIRVTGDDCVLAGVSALSNRVGIEIAGDRAEIRGATVERGSSHGIEILNGASASISASRFESNGGAGVRIHPAAGDVTVGPSMEPPEPIAAGQARIPIGTLSSPPLIARAGLSHSIVGTLSIDGLPAPAGTTVEVYLDRRLAASVAVDDLAGFSATAAGPGTELRFAVDGVPLDQRIDFEPGARTSVTLRAVSARRLVSSDRSGDHLPEANRFLNNLAAVTIMPVNAARAGQRVVWGNQMQRNRQSIVSELRRPVIEHVSWSASGLNLQGISPGAGVAHLYAGPSGRRAFVASVPVIDGRFRFRSLDVDAMATEFTVIAHTAERRATPESNVHREPLPGSITSISPDHGYIEGGETVRICGSRIATDAIAPQVWFGNHAARVVLWSDECVTVTTPPSVAGPTDVALLLRGARPVIATDAFEYRTVRLVNLQQGWNLVVWTGADTRVTTAFASLAGSSFRAYSWDPDRQDWEIFSTELPPRLNTLRTIKHDQPLWILLETAGHRLAPTRPQLSPRSPIPLLPRSPAPPLRGSCRRLRGSISPSPRP